MSPGKAVPGLERHPAKARLASVGDPDRPRLHARPQTLPGLAAAYRGQLGASLPYRPGRCHNFGWRLVLEGKHHAGGKEMRVFVTGGFCARVTR